MQPSFHALDPSSVAAHFSVDPTVGLSDTVVNERRQQYGENALAEAERVPAWKRLIEQFRDFLILILIGAAALSLIVSNDVKTPIIVLVVVIANALIGFIQESRAEASLEALRKMLTATARVRRNGSLVNLPFNELVPGDVVLVEAGDRIPADARIITATNMEVDEAALTGESQPVEKSATPVPDPNASIGDRASIAHMNATVTRGRGELIVTQTGMSTEIGRIANMLRSAPNESTPLQRQLDGLAHSLAALAGVIVVLVAVIGLLRGDAFADVMMRAVALAVAAIPEGLPAVTVVTLAIGVSKMARENAIIKRLASVETLGCTNVICSDKTGTLTLNQMTARELVVQDARHAVSGEGYSPIGAIDRSAADEPVSIVHALQGMALCSDAEVREVQGEWMLTGDPTEGALVVLAMKGDVDVTSLRSRHPRLNEVPFDSEHKFMATLHEMVDELGSRELRLYVKGAPDVLMARSSTAIGRDGVATPISHVEDSLHAHNNRIAGSGHRVLAVAHRTFPVEMRDELIAHGSLIDLVHDLTFVGLIGIVDPPRPEAIEAIRQAHAAGIEVKMITGDHVSTATAIARELGLSGGSINGAELASMTDDELTDRIDSTAVFARVAPEHKMRIVRALKSRGNVVAMTGDGVNDAPALKNSDIGIAMGITGTEVSKEAATMVLTDDNFSTIVRAVRQGRAIYDNIVHFVCFQLSTTIGFAALFLLSAIFNIAHSKPFTAVAILWVNIIMDGPPAMALGLDRPARDAMSRPPRQSSERILTRERWFKVLLSAGVMAAGTAGVLLWHPDGAAPSAGVPSVAGTMAFNTFVLFQFFNILNVRTTATVFRRETFHNSRLWLALAGVILLQVGTTYVGFLQDLFDTTSIDPIYWLWSILIASSVLWVEELRKFLSR